MDQLNHELHENWCSRDIGETTACVIQCLTNSIIQRRIQYIRPINIFYARLLKPIQNHLMVYKIGKQEKCKNDSFKKY